MRSGKCWTISVLASLLLAVLSGLGRGLEEPEPSAEEGSSTRLHVSTCPGWVSVDMCDAEVGKSSFAQGTGLAITGSPRAGIRISVRLMDVELEAGLRRLLWTASPSYAIRYAQGPKERWPHRRCGYSGQ